MWSKLVVDMQSLTVSKEPLDDAYRELGGKALIAQYMINNVPPQCDPLGAQNQLILCTSVFAGTKFTTTHRLSIGGKSPLTGGIKESNVGGYAAALLAEQGIKLIVVKNIPAGDGLWMLHIDAAGNASLEDAGAYAGVNNYEFAGKMRERFGDKLATVSIGSAGERLYKSASIQVTEFGYGHPSRAAGRGGLGALMGSKRIKAVVIEKPKEPFKVQYADEAKFNEVCQKLNKMIAAGAKNDPFHNIGTISTIEATGANGILPVDNFSGKLFPAYTEVGANKFMTNLATRGGRNKLACQPGCVVQCSNIYNDQDGNYLTSGFEYETIALFGPNCHIADLDAIAKMDRICDDIGVDTIETANAVAMCMETGKIKWGDADAALALLDEMVKGTEFGKLLGNGCEAVGQSLGCQRIPVVKHQALPGYDPRNTKGTGITYATSPMGADHTAGLTMGRAFDDCGRAAQAYASNKLQVAMCFADSMMCIFAFAHMVPGIPLLADMMAALYGGKADITRVTIGLGVKTLLTERAFNKAAGMTAEDDRLPEFFYKERSAATGSQFDINDYELEVLFDF
ncbi:aldehyde ferredoxin oxidoreductase C-terminal domain-containing protein [Desulfallas thermosapovorans]|uniref:Aldehyde:ferredoxin oxidoreductase n=1 Tax=Desulfallas thermosapovorans DSM 6562 TaxID=1121431 RepID=A0A5S4ZW61_9FIRM|nr:aldehyde ferredoxin oxidoreductase C-terminal domain-containing protein [Desulfallas thermosapovorans]TYO96456.1 aldehyde:ferredoxin oxidoreductase [Desulfallas thermosapovorans DSM 6562]